MAVGKLLGLLPWPRVCEDAWGDHLSHVTVPRGGLWNSDPCLLAAACTLTFSERLLPHMLQGLGLTQKGFQVLCNLG